MAGCAAGQRGFPRQEGIANFGKINDRLYRGAQPDAIAITNLKRLGIKTIINLRMPDDAERAEKIEADASGITYTNMTMKSLGRPTDERVKEVLSLIETLPSPVFVHCKYGCDRTGTIIACYRIEHDKWSSVTALREAQQYGQSRFVRGMKRFVVDFDRLRSE